MLGSDLLNERGLPCLPGSADKNGRRVGKGIEDVLQDVALVHN